MLVCIVDSGQRGLNMRQLLNPIFFSPVSVHTDGTRQRKARLHRLDMRRARALKSGPPTVIDLPIVWEPKPSRWDSNY